MPEYDNKNRFVLFKNEKKESEKHPDYTGTFTDEQGREYFMDAWIKRGQNNRTFMSGKVKLKEKQPAQSTPAPAPAKAPQSTDEAPDDIPF